MAEKAFTMGTPEMVRAMIESDQLDESYEMVLNRGDMHAVIVSLAMNGGFITSADISEETQERAMSLFSGIATTLGIEGV